MTLDDGRLKDAERLIRLCNGRDPMHGRHQQILQPRRFLSLLRLAVPKPAAPHSPAKLLRRRVSLLDAVYGARHWPWSLVHAPETLFYAHLVPLFRDVGIWPLCPRTVAFRKRDDSDHPDGRFLPNSARAYVVAYPLTAGLTIPPSATTVCATVVPIHSREKVWGARCTESRHFSQITTTIVSE
jgi:hypothetical protein